MSEYQYYEFQAVDRRLTEMEMQELRRYSTRARITATSFVNEYQWGDFRGNAKLWMEKYFDGHLYYANWGTRVLQLALPAKVLPVATADLYCASQSAKAHVKKGRMVLTFTSDPDEGGDYPDEEDLLSSLLSLRTELAQGDLRCLYLGWLLGVQTEELDKEELEPPVPSNLGKWTHALRDFAEFFRLDRKLIEAAAKASPQTEKTPVTRKEIAAWVGSLPSGEKDKILVGLMADEDVHAHAELLAQFNKQRAVNEPGSRQRRRTVGELLAAAGLAESHD